jgi:DNA-binding NarL/FixJ family response regulator
MIQLTTSEQAIYNLLVNEGMRTKDIAKALGYTTRTLEIKMGVILQKAQVTSQKELIVKHYTEIIKEFARLCPSVSNL